MTALGIAINSGLMKTSQFLSKHLNTEFDGEVKNQSSPERLKELPDNMDQKAAEIIPSFGKMNNSVIVMEVNISQSIDTGGQYNGTKKSPRKADITNVRAAKLPRKYEQGEVCTGESPRKAELTGVCKSSRKSPRKGTKRKFEEEENDEENKVSEPDSEETEKDSDINDITDIFEFSKNLRKRLKSDKDNNNNDDSVTRIKTETDQKSSCVDSVSMTRQVSEESCKEMGRPGARRQSFGNQEKRGRNVGKSNTPNVIQSRSVHRSENQTITRSRSVGHRTVKRKAMVDLEQCPKLSPHLLEERTQPKESVEECPPKLSPKPSLNILEEARFLAEKQEKSKASKVRCLIS